MKILIVGGDGFIGKHLARRFTDPRHDVVATSRRKDAQCPFNLLTGDPHTLPDADVVYLVAAMAKFKECELPEFRAYETNVDAPIRVAARFKDAFIVFLSSEAAEWGGNTQYGRLKQLAELGLLSVCGYDRVAIVRPSQITSVNMHEFCDLLVAIGTKRLHGVTRC